MGKIKVGAVWKKEGPYGAFFSGMMNVPIIVEENKYKKPGDNQPDLVLYVAEDQATVEARKARQAQNRNPPQKGPETQPTRSPPINQKRRF